jgi:hypothetical protein
MLSPFVRRRKMRDWSMAGGTLLMDRTTSHDPIVRFYSLEGVDAEGRTLEQIWGWDHRRLEGVHDYIQWLFPLRERSRFNPAAPVLTDRTIDTFSRDDVLKDRLKRSLALMLEFYGLALVEQPGAPPGIVRAGAFAARSGNWLRMENHNHLRLTRILTSTRILGLPAYSEALFQCLDSIYRGHPEAISPATHQFWKRAASSA